MSRIRIAVVGTGHLGKIHSRLIRQNARADLVAVVDPAIDVASSVASELGTRAAKNHDELYGDIDAAIVAAPTVVHEQIANDFINAGIHVFVEKPITIHPAAARRLIKSAKHRDVKLQVGHVEQFNPAWTTSLPMLENPLHISAQRCSPFSFRSTDISVVHDLMIHDIELMLSVVNSSVHRISAWGQSVLTAFEDTASALIEFDDGRTAQLTASRIHHTPIRQMHIHSENRQVNVDFANSSVTEIVNGQPFNPQTANPQTANPIHSPSVEDVMTITRHEVIPGNAIQQEHDDFIDSILFDRQPRVSGSRGHDALVIADRVVTEIRKRFGQSLLRPAA